MKFSDYAQYVENGLFTMEKHQNADIFIFGYHSGPYSKSKNIWNDVTKRMRGLIVNSEGKILARAFEKFFTFRGYLSENNVLLSEGQIAILPELPYKIYEKLDGTMTILYWIDDIPYLATQRSFSSLKAKKATQILHTKYSHTFDKINKKRSYIFEAIYPESQVLIDYGDNEDLILIGVLDNESGNTLPLEDIGFPIAKDWGNQLKNITNLKDLENLNIRNIEGFVLVYENNFRIKIKFPWYKEAHSLMNKIILLEHNIDLAENKLKELLSIRKNIPSTIKIWKRFSKGETPSEILRNFPNAYKFFGIEEWLESQYEIYGKDKNENPHKHIYIPPLNENLKLEELIYKAASENIMNNRMLNLKKKYN